MSQVDGWYYPEQETPYTVVACPRRDCRLVARSYQTMDREDLDVELIEAFRALVDESSPDPDFLQPVKEGNDRCGRQLNIDRRIIWDKTDGQCFYCGVFLQNLSTMTIDHVISSDPPDHSLENLVPACRSCNCSKGPKTLEEFRFLVAMKGFRRTNKVSFTMKQVAYLKKRGFDIGLPEHVFWFEQDQGE